MNTISKKKLTPEYIDHVRNVFRDAGLTIPIFAEFFAHLRMIIGVDEKTPTERIREVLDDHVFKGKDDFERVTTAWFGYYNATVGLLESFNVTSSADKQMAAVDEIFRALEDASSGEDIPRVLKANSIEFLIYLSDLSGAAFDKKKRFDADRVFRELGDALGEVFTHIAAIYRILDEEKPDREQLCVLFTGLVGNAYVINEDRKANFIPDEDAGNEPYHKNPDVGRNDPCPCGSGKKYKKCCLEKDVNPFHDLLPVNPPLPRLNRDEIDEFYRLYNIFMKHALALKTGTDVKEVHDFCVKTPSSKNCISQEYGYDVPLVCDLLKFIKKNTSKIVKSCLATVGEESDDGKILAAWKSAIAGSFLVFEHASSGCSILYSVDKSKKKSGMFLTYGLHDDLSAVIGTPPVMGDAMLFPFRGRIVFGCLFIPNPVIMKRGLVNMLTDEYIAQRKSEHVIPAIEK